MANPRIGIIIGTLREGRFADKPAQWILDHGARRTDLDFETVDLRDYPLALLGASTVPEAMAAAAPETIAKWKQKLDELDGYLFITAEYNHSISSALKNVLDYAYSEFNKKPAAFIGYGGVGGARAVEQLRLICVELQLAPLRTAVHIGMEAYQGVAREGKHLADFDYLNKTATAMLDDLAWWTHTLKAGRLDTSVI